MKERGGERRAIRPLTSALLALSMVSGSVLFGAALRATAAPTFSAINGSVYGSADHELVATDQLSNFRTGAIDNWYPLAFAHVDGSPGAAGRATFADTGPGFGTVVSAANDASPQKVNQPQYVGVSYPYPPGTSSSDEVGAPGGPYARASAELNAATARASLADTTEGGSSAGNNRGRAQMLSKLDAALRAWRNRYLSADDQYRYPMPKVSATEPDGILGDVAASSVIFDPEAGLLTVTTDTRVASASLGGGAIVIKGIHVAATITHDGVTPKPSTIVEVAHAEIGGVPILIDQDGVSVNGSAVPGVAEAIAQASDALNQVLASAGINIFLVGTSTVLDGQRVSVEAAGVMVSFVQPAVTGVPNQSVVHVLGEARADALAELGTAQPSESPSPTFSPSGGGTTTTTTTTTTTGGGDNTGSGTTTSPAPQPQPPTTAVAYALPKPGWLVGLYFLWEVILVMTGLSLWWWRAEKLPTPSP